MVTNKMYTLNGVSIPHDDDIISDKVVKSLERGNYENTEIRALPLFLKPEDRVLELGAGIGYISSYAAKVIGVQSVACVEANPKLVEFIKKVHAGQGIENATVTNCVAVPDNANITDGEGTEFYIREPFWSSSLDSGREFVKSEKVPQRYLSKLIKEQNATTLIVDIEGGEKTLFEDVDLGSVVNIYLELHTRYIRPKGIKACFDAMSRHGFYYDQRVSSGGVVLFRKLGSAK